MKIDILGTEYDLLYCRENEMKDSDNCGECNRYTKTIKINKEYFASEDAEKYGMNEQMKSSSEKPNKSEIPTDWIPVSERLPEEDGEYLLFGKVTDEDENCIFIGEYDACAEKFGIWQELFDRDTLGCLDSDFYEYESVKAWMYLPSK